MLNTVFDRLGGYPPRPPESLRSESAGNQHIQRSHGEKRYTRAESQALGGGSAHAKAGILMALQKMTEASPDLFSTLL